MKRGFTNVIEYFAKECKLNIKDLNDVCSNILYMYVYNIILGGVTCYNSGWGYYSNIQEVFLIIIVGGAIIVIIITYSGGVACYNSGWGYYSNNHCLFRRCCLL